MPPSLSFPERGHFCHVPRIVKSLRVIIRSTVNSARHHCAHPQDITDTSSGCMKFTLQTATLQPVGLVPKYLPGLNSQYFSKRTALSSSNRIHFPLYLRGTFCAQSVVVKVFLLSEKFLYIYLSIQFHSSFKASRAASAGKSPNSSRNDFSSFSILLYYHL